MGGTISDSKIFFKVVNFSVPAKVNNDIILSMEEISTENIDTEKEFQNLLAKRSQLVTMLIATVAGTVGLAYIPLTGLSFFLIPSGIFFITRLIISLNNTEKKINKIVEGK